MTKKSINVLSALFCLILTPIALSAAEDDYNKLIIGTWAEEIDSRGNIYFYDTYFPNGKMHGYGYVEPMDPNSYFFADGTWEIKNGMSCITITYSSDKLIKPGEYWCDKIVKLNHEVFIYQSEGKNITMYRVSDGSVK